MESTFLSDILVTLRRLETQVQGQNDRLSAIEFSFRSGATSPGTPPRSPATDGSIVESTTPLSSLAESLAESYAQSVLKLKQRFEFLHDSRSEIRSGPEELGELSGGRDDIFDREAFAAMRLDADEDAYSVSVYSSRTRSRPLSRLLLDVPPVPPLPAGLQLERRAEPSFIAVTRLDDDSGSSAPSAPEPTRRGLGAELARFPTRIASFRSARAAARPHAALDRPNGSIKSLSSTVRPAVKNLAEKLRHPDIHLNSGLASKLRQHGNCIVQAEISPRFHSGVVKMKKSCSSLATQVRLLAAAGKTHVAARGYFVPV